MRSKKPLWWGICTVLTLSPLLGGMLLLLQSHEPLHAIPTKTPKHYTSGWEYDYLKLERNPYNGQGVKVAVLDTQVSSISLTTLQAHEEFLHTSAVPTKGKTHADMILSVLRYTAPKVEVYHGVVANEVGTVQKESLISGLQWAIQQQVYAINISISFPRKDNEIESLLKKAYDKGILVIAASGNDGSAHVSYPASSPYVIAVGGSDVEGKKWTMSNFGQEISFCMPSSYIRTDESNLYTSYREGTSYSSILLTAVLARLIEMNPTVGREQLLEALRHMAGDNNRTDLCGYGIPTF